MFYFCVEGLSTSPSSSPPSPLVYVLPPRSPGILVLPLFTVFCGLNWIFQSFPNDLIFCFSSQRLGFCLLVVNDALLVFPLVVRPWPSSNFLSLPLLLGATEPATRSCVRSSGLNIPVVLPTQHLNQMNKRKLTHSNYSTVCLILWADIRVCILKYVLLVVFFKRFIFSRENTFLTFSEK